MYLPTITPLLPLIFLSVSAHPSFHPSPQHGRCKLTADLTESLPHKSPRHASITLHLKDRNGIAFTQPEWSNGQAISTSQEIRSDQAVFLNDVIDIGSEMRVQWNVTSKTDWLQFEYTRHRGGTDAAVISWGDQVVDVGYATCSNAYNVWVEKKGKRTRSARCEFNC